MAEQKDFNSLDELFRKSFDNLPESPATSGWDQPGDRVWQHVQARIKPPGQGWSSGQILLAVSAAVVIALGIYLAFARPKPPVATTPAATEQVVAPAQPATPAVSQNTAPIERVESPAAIPAAATPRRSAPVEQPQRNMDEPGPTAPPPNNTIAPDQPAAGSTGQRAIPTGSAPLPGSRPVSPNTTELRKNEGARRNLWAMPLKPLPTTLERRQAPPLPALLRRAVPPAADPGKQ